MEKWWKRMGRETVFVQKYLHWHASCSGTGQASIEDFFPTSETSYISSWMLISSKKHAPSFRTLCLSCVVPKHFNSCSAVATPWYQMKYNFLYSQVQDLNTGSAKNTVFLFFFSLPLFVICFISCFPIFCFNK